MIGGEEGELPVKPVVPGELIVLTKVQRNAAYKKQVETGLINYDVFEKDTEHLAPETPMKEVIELFKDQKSKLNKPKVK
ncbi:MAG: hypothetical protein WC894_00265 [Patescibacteria group bacterium]